MIFAEIFQTFNLTYFKNREKMGPLYQEWVLIYGLPVQSGSTHAKYGLQSTISKYG